MPQSTENLRLMVSVPREDDRYCEHRSHGATVSLRTKAQEVYNFMSEILIQHNSPVEIAQVLKSALFSRYAAFN